MNNSVYFYEENGISYPKVDLPNASVVLALGISSIPLCFCYGILGIICAVISLVLYSESEKKYRFNPNRYTNESYNNMKTGRICAIIGLCCSITYIILVVLFYIFFIFGLFLSR